jgi:uncharacterized protein (TIGR02757 family)
MTAMDPQLKIRLDRLYEDYLNDYRLSPGDFLRRRRDPILFPHRYTMPLDIEAAGFLAATFAYGNVTSLCNFVHNLLQALGPSPHSFLMDGPKRVKSLAGSRLGYRFHKTVDILRLLSALARIYRQHDSLYMLFLPFYYRYSTMKGALSGFVANLRSYSPEPGALKFLLPSPADGSACKRLNLFLRWMVRRDGIDFGLWKDVSPSRLVMPVDTHIGRLAFRFGWINSPSPNWRKAEQITDTLRGCNTEDPLRYDFSLCHESMEKGGRFHEEK